MNVAVGGTNGFFPDGVSNPSPKPWWNGSPTVSIFNYFILICVLTKKISLSISSYILLIVKLPAIMRFFQIKLYFIHILNVFLHLIIGRKRLLEREISLVEHLEPECQRWIGRIYASRLRPHLGFVNEHPLTSQKCTAK